MDGPSTAIILPMSTYSGKEFYPLDPKPEDISIVDIAHHLSNICRYGGACQTYYSVAQHSVICAAETSYENRKWALLHDAPEAYIGDIIHPLKVTDQYETYREIEEKLMAAVCDKFGLDPIMPEEVHEVDMYVRHTEMRDFGSMHKRYWEGKNMAEYTITPLTPNESKILFLKEFSRLFGYDANAWRYFE